MKQNSTDEKLKQGRMLRDQARMLREQSRMLREQSYMIEKEAEQQLKQEAEQEKDKDRSKFKKIRKMCLSNVENEGLSYVEFADPEICEYADMDGVVDTRYTDQFIEDEQVFRYRASEDKQK